MYQIVLVAVVFLFLGCGRVPTTQGALGYSDGRRVIIVGEHVDRAIAYYYQKKYEAPVWFTPSEGKLADTANKIIDKVNLAPSGAMQGLINELKSINYTVGRWEFIVPAVGEAYFVATLSHMGTGALAKARGVVVLPESTGSPTLERQLRRVTGGNFYVTFGSEKFTKEKKSIPTLVEPPSDM